MKDELKINGFSTVADGEMVDVNGGIVLMTSTFPIIISILKKILDWIF